MPTFDPAAFGARLRDAMEKRGFDVKKLREKVENEVISKTGKKRGTSYGTVWSYVNGQAPLEPRREVVEALAEVLSPERDHLLPHFLMFGEGPRTLAEAAAGAVADAGDSDDSNLTADRAELEKAFLEGLPALSAAGAASWHAIGDLYSQYVSAHGVNIFVPVMREGMERVASGEDHDPAAFKEKAQLAQVEAARRVAELVGAAAKAADLDLLQLSRWEIDRYIQITAQALSVLFGPTGPLRRGRPTVDRKKAEKETPDAQE